jgi:hypothetical protein
MHPWSDYPYWVDTTPDIERQPNGNLYPSLPHQTLIWLTQHAVDFTYYQEYSGNGRPNIRLGFRDKDQAIMFKLWYQK